MDPVTRKIRQAYNQLAAEYDARIDDKPHNAYYDRPNTLALLPEVKGKHVLDAACGPGKYAEILLGRGARVTGLDLSPRMIELARRRTSGAGTFFVHDLARPLAMLTDAACDVVLCALALHYLRDWGPTIREFHRVLRPGGTLVVSLEHPFFDYGYYNSEAYFDVEQVTATWTGFGTPVEMPGYRRPLHACIAPLTDNGFYLDRLVEPRPVPAFEDRDPKHYRELNDFPAFMMLRGIRR